MSCLACDRIARIAAGKDRDFVLTLPETHVVLADEQVYRGYCILYPVSYTHLTLPTIYSV